MGTVLRNVGKNIRFTEFRFFENVKNINSGSPFQGNTFTRVKFPPKLEILTWYNPYYLPCTILDLPTTATVQNAYCNNVKNLKVLIVRSATVKFDLGYAGNLRNSAIYVPQESVEEYKVASGWSDVSSNILPIEGSPYEKFNEWEYDG